MSVNFLGILFEMVKDQSYRHNRKGVITGAYSNGIKFIF